MLMALSAGTVVAIVGARVSALRLTVTVEVAGVLPVAPVAVSLNVIGVVPAGTGKSFVPVAANGVIALTPLSMLKAVEFVTTQLKVTTVPPVEGTLTLGPGVPAPVLTWNVVIVGAGMAAATVTFRVAVVSPAEFVAVSVKMVSTLTPVTVAVTLSAPKTGAGEAGSAAKFTLSAPVTVQDRVTLPPPTGNLSPGTLEVNDLMTGFSTGVGGQAVKVAARINKKVAGNHLRIFSPCHSRMLES